MAAMSLLEPNHPPPPHYYAQRVLDLLAGVTRQYSDLLPATEQSVIAAVRAVSPNAQRLFSRLWTRTGPTFRLDSLHYAEVGDVGAAVTELEGARLVRVNDGCPADTILARLTVSELRGLFPRITERRKRGLVDAICAMYPEQLVLARVADAHPFITIVSPAALDRLQLLYFGGPERDLSTFVLEDLGVLRFEPYRLDPARRQFDTYEDFARFAAFRSFGTWLHELAARWDVTLAQYVIEALWAPNTKRILERRRVRLLNRLGRQAERVRDFDTALTAYRRAARAPARERVIRILTRLGDADGARRGLDQILAAPQVATERLFADGFGRRRPALAEDRLVLAAAPCENVEAATLAALIDHETIGRHLENRLSLGVLGLAFWDVVFASVPGAFVNPYQDRPLDLYWPDFRGVRCNAIQSRLAMLTDQAGLRRQVSWTWRNRYGVSNALVAWAAFDEPFLERLLREVPASHWCLVFDHMLNDLGQSRTGFPDLILLRRGGYELIEVKGPGDQLRMEQRAWFEFFRRHQLPARVLRVSW